MDNQTSKVYSQGASVRAADADFLEGLRAAVDYRGDSTILLKDGSSVEGYIFSYSKLNVDIFLKSNSEKISVLISDVVEIKFTGEDTALGKSWEDYQKKKALKN